MLPNFIYSYFVSQSIVGLESQDHAHLFPMAYCKIDQLLVNEFSASNDRNVNIWVHLVRYHVSED